MKTPNLDRLIESYSGFEYKPHHQSDALAAQALTMAHRSMVDSAQSELSALRQRCEDLDLFAHSLYHDWNRDWFYYDKEKEWVLYDRASDSPSAKELARCKDDGTGLPLLSPEAREALRKAVR
jgi:hypothetical protein